MLNEEQVREIKQQLLKQLENFPEDQRESVIKQVESMNAEELEQFLVKNKLIGENRNNAGKKEEECIFCNILQGRVPSYKIDENKSSIAILEINPLSPGHSIIISKKHSNLASGAFSLANKLGKRIKRKLKAEETKIENATIFGHQMINLIPVYKGKNLEKRKAEERELILMQEKLKAKPRKKKEKSKVQVSVESLEKAPVRIP